MAVNEAANDIEIMRDKNGMVMMTMKDLLRLIRLHEERELSLPLSALITASWEEGAEVIYVQEDSATVYCTIPLTPDARLAGEWTRYGEPLPGTPS